MPEILLVCPEPLGHGHPAGVGIRFLEFARILREDGFTPIVLSPDGASVEGCVTAESTPATLHDMTARATAAIVQGHAVHGLFQSGRRIPTVVDLYDPYIVENFHYLASHGSEVFLHDHQTLTLSVERGDFFLCASEAQRLFYLGFFLSLGKLNPAVFESDPTLSALLAIAPFGVAPSRVIPRKELDAPRVLFGGIYDWYDPKLAIEAVRIARERIPGLSITFTSHPNAELTPQSVARATREAASGLDFVRFDPWFAYDKRAEYYDSFHCALISFGRSLETDLAMRTRMFDFLWGGLPVITSSAPGTDEIVRTLDAGTVVEGDDPQRFAEALVSLLADRATYEKKVAGASTFARTHQWRTLAEPLLAFCRQPRMRPQEFFALKHGSMRSHADSLLRRLRMRLRRSS